MWLRHAAAALAAILPHAAQGHFVASLHSNFVVNLDFEGGAGKLPDGGEADAEAGEVKVMAFAGGKRKFKCSLPTKRNGTIRAGGSSPDASKAKKHFINAKLVSLRGSCWKFRKDYWSYEICFSRKITQFRPDSDMRFSLGDHIAEKDELFSDGSIKEYYFGGTENRTTEIHYRCGSSEESSKTFDIEERRALYYEVALSGPQFCSWWEKDGAQATDSEGNTLQVSALLEGLRGSCVNVTQGWWTYEYCYPRTLQQYHLAGKTRDPVHILGTLNGTDAVTAVNRVNMTMVRLKPSISPRERREPPSKHRTLRQHLAGGTVCDETHRARQTTMHFQCPPNWQSRPETKIVSINEGSLCEYQVVVHTTLVCGHPRLLPTLPSGKETINCVATSSE
mmetsp:Transcript_25058/g.70638  ORF Transcript_25058/g.70638 Transcript_25058/m.70638 type:complete len:393 (+) Transcript_25058:60-1238(+)